LQSGFLELNKFLGTGPTSDDIVPLKAEVSDPGAAFTRAGAGAAGEGAATVCSFIFIHSENFITKIGIQGLVPWDTSQSGFEVNPLVYVFMESPAKHIDFGVKSYCQSL